MTNSRIYLRQVGVSENQFYLLLTQLKQEIERPIKKQESCYLGKKRYTMKTQLLVSPESKMIYGIASSKGKTHMILKCLTDSKTHIPQVLTKFFLLPKPAYTKFDKLIRKLSKFYPNFFIFGSGLAVTFLCRAEIFAISICSSS